MISKLVSTSLIFAMFPFQLSASNVRDDLNYNELDIRVAIEETTLPELGIVRFGDGQSVMNTGEPQGLGSVLIFIAGIVVGYIADGVVVNTTGQSSAQWVSVAIDWLNAPRYPLNQTNSITISSDQTRVSTFVTDDGNICTVSGSQYECLYRFGE